MNEQPILFGSPMVLALLEGRKTQTRRIVKLPRWAEPEFELEENGVSELFAIAKSTGCLAPVPCPYGEPVDRLWVKEVWTGTWHPTRQSENHMLLQYRADGAERFLDAPDDYVLPKAATKVGSFVTPLFMPRWASRITLEVTEVRVQRLQEISEADAIAEGVAGDGVFFQNYSRPNMPPNQTARSSFFTLWESINGPDSWDANPWVWAVSFKPVAVAR